MRLSVVIPFFNAERWLATAIDSALAQDASAEIIAVDDGSTDGGRAIAEGYAPRVRCVSRPNGGTGEARNTGLAAATGDYVIFLDADDVFEGALLAGVARAASGGADIVISPSGERTAAHRGLHDRRWQGQPRNDVILDVAAGRTVVIHAQAFRREFLSAAGGFRTVHNEDTELLLRLLLSGATLGFNRDGLALWCLRENHDGMSVNYTEPAIRSALGWHRDHRRMLPLAADPRLLEAYGRRCYALAGVSFERGYRGVGREALTLARSFGYRNHDGGRIHRVLAGALGLERKVALARLWRGLRARAGMPKATPGVVAEG